MFTRLSRLRFTLAGPRLVRSTEGGAPRAPKKSDLRAKIYKFSIIRPFHKSIFLALISEFLALSYYGRKTILKREVISFNLLSSVHNDTPVNSAEASK